MTNLVPDSGVQKNVILKQDLPMLDSNRKYFVRYRVKTKDGSVSSAWSPVYQPIKPSIEGLFNPNTGTHNADEREIKSHGKSFDVSWKIKNTITDLIEIPEQIKDLPLDAYVRWGGLISNVSPNPAGNSSTFVQDPNNSNNYLWTVSLNYVHNFYVGQVITAEGTTQDNQINYTVNSIVSQQVFTVSLPKTVAPTYLAANNRLWSRWEYISTITGNSFSVPIPLTHQTTISTLSSNNTKYAEFMVHLATVTKDRQETDPETLIFYTESVSTAGIYDSGSPA